jgi:hypothetical protein
VPERPSTLCSRAGRPIMLGSFTTPPQLGGHGAHRSVAGPHLLKIPDPVPFSQTCPRGDRRMPFRPRLNRARQVWATPDRRQQITTGRPPTGRSRPHVERRSLARATAPHCGPPTRSTVVSPNNSTSSPASTVTSTTNPSSPKAVTGAVTSPLTGGFFTVVIS